MGTYTTGHIDETVTTHNTQGLHPQEKISQETSANTAGAAQKSAGSTGRKSSSAFRTISEVADELDVQQHVLRFWETKFSQVRPLKRGGGRRYYRPEDVQLLKAIHNLLYTQGYTIKGVQKLLREVGKKKILEETGVLDVADSKEAAPSVKAQTAQQSAQAATPQAQGKKNSLDTRQKQVLNDVLDELKDLRAIIRGEK